MVEAFKSPGVGNSNQLSDKNKLTKTNACITDKNERDGVTQSLETETGKENDSLTIQYLNQFDFRVNINHWIEHDVNEVIVALFAIEFDDFILSADALGEEFSATLLDHSSQWFANDGPSGAKFTVLNSGRLLVAVQNIKETEMIWQIGRQLQQVFVNSVNSGLIDYDLHAYIGISLYPLIADNVDDLVNTSISALALAKSNQREPVCLFDTLKSEKRKQSIVRLSELKNALVHGREIENFYQPKQSLVDERLIGFEALVRWRHPQAGMLPPAEFIELAEENGVICQITDRVLQTVCRDFATFKQLGFRGVISINVSAKDFERPNFVTELCKTLKAYQVPPGDIELEITETAFIQDFDRCYLVLSALREIGFKLAIDDFGKGYSSLSYLKKLPVDTIKVDKEFIEDIESSPEVQSVFEALLKIAHTQKLNVVAEGVETEEQKRILKRMKCDHIQGYLLSRPVPLNELNRSRLNDFSS